MAKAEPGRLSIVTVGQAPTKHIGVDGIPLCGHYADVEGQESEYHRLTEDDALEYDCLACAHVVAELNARRRMSSQEWGASAEREVFWDRTR